MPNFKPKSIKKIKFNKKTAVTLDTKHKEFLTEFTNDETDVIPELKAERRELKTKLLNEYDELTLEGRIDLEDKVAEITTRIREINAKKKYPGDPYVPDWTEFAAKHAGWQYKLPAWKLNSLEEANRIPAASEQPADPTAPTVIPSAG